MDLPDDWNLLFTDTFEGSANVKLSRVERNEETMGRASPVCQPRSKLRESWSEASATRHLGKVGRGLTKSSRRRGYTDIMVEIFTG